MTCVSRAHEKLKLQTVSRQDMTQESATYRQTEAECLSNKQQATSNKQRVPNCKNRVNDKISDRVPGDRLCSDSTCKRLQRTGELCKDERRSSITECKMLGMLGTEGFEKVRRVYATNALTPTIKKKKDRIKILID